MEAPHHDGRTPLSELTTRFPDNASLRDFFQILGLEPPYAHRCLFLNRRLSQALKDSPELAISTIRFSIADGQFHYGALAVNPSEILVSLADDLRVD